ncbi:MAG: glycine oxidase ThiO [Acidobacteria bacterium]|nr:glycine oxidase ThiO [Acidobacteriota bacterium]
MKSDVLIVGGGVIGCALALKLAEAGCKVLLMERGRLGCEASSAAAGMLSPQTESLQPDEFFNLCIKSRALYKNFVAHLKEASDIDAQLREEGTLFVSLPHLQDHADEWAQWQLEAGLRVERIPAEELERLEPAVTKQATRAIFMADDLQVENRLLMLALAVAIRRAGVTVIEGEAVTEVLLDHQQVAGVVCGSAKIYAGAVVIAAGSWSGALLEKFGVEAITIPARGQMIAVQSAAIRHVLHSSQVYLVPRNDGRLLIGATVEYSGFEKGNTAKGIRALLDAAIELVPEVADAEIVETWSGLRPDTPDHWPIIGESGIANLWLATGHFRNGILLAPITAELMMQSLLLNRTVDQLQPFGLHRFATLPALHS